MARPKSGLGRGLGALIPGPDETDLDIASGERAGGTLEVPVGSIVPNPLAAAQVDVRGVASRAGRFDPRAPA